MSSMSGSLICSDISTCVSCTYTPYTNDTLFNNSDNIIYQGHKGLTWYEVVEACEEYERNNKPQKASKSDMVIGLLFLLLLPLIGYLPFFIKSLG